MLVMMTFEVGLLFAAALGLGLGKFIICFIKLPKPLESDPAITIKWKRDMVVYEPNPDPCCSKPDGIHSTMQGRQGAPSGKVESEKALEPVPEAP